MRFPFGVGLFACGCFAIDGAGGAAVRFQWRARISLRVLQGGFTVALGSSKSPGVVTKTRARASPAVDRWQHSGGAGDAGFADIADGTGDEAAGNYCKILHGEIKRTRTAGMMFLSRRGRLLTTRARRAPLCGDTIPSCTVDSAETKTHGGIKSRWSDGIRMRDCCGHPYSRKATREYQQRKTRRRSPAPALMLISPVARPPAGRITGTEGTRKYHVMQISPTQQ